MKCVGNRWDGWELRTDSICWTTSQAKPGARKDAGVPDRLEPDSRPIANDCSNRTRGTLQDLVLCARLL